MYELPSEPKDINAPVELQVNEVKLLPPPLKLGKGKEKAY